MSRIRITDIILDYDGTCTRIPLVYEGFLRTYFEGFAAQMEKAQNPITKHEWKNALDAVRKNSPIAGWTVNNTPSAPAAADPYILAFETACHILRRHQMGNVLPDVNNFLKAYEENTPPWREDAATTFTALQDAGIRLHFISNSSTATITKRQEVLNLKQPIPVEGSAAKYRICELTWDPQPGSELPDEARKIFESLPPAYESSHLTSPGRPVYVRRGSYFEAICRALKNDVSRLATTVVCGDVWELDIALPHKLGTHVHLMEREAPFDTYPYEREIVKSYGSKARIGNNLSDLLQWL